MIHLAVSKIFRERHDGFGVQRDGEQLSYRRFFQR